MTVTKGAALRGPHPQPQLEAYPRLYQVTQMLNETLGILWKEMDQTETLDASDHLHDAAEAITRALRSVRGAAEAEDLA